MNNILTKLFMVIMLMMFSMGAQADVKVLYGEKGTEKFEGKGGSIKIEQADSKVDKTIVTVYLTFIPQSGYTFDEKTLEVYAVVSPDGAFTRAPQILGDPLKLTEEKTDVPSAKRYSVDIDSNLGLWVKKAEFQLNGSKETTRTTDYSGVYYIGVYGKNSTSECASFNPADNYYLCPTEGWCYYVATNSVQADDNGQPFLTSYKCRDGEYDADKAVWVITKHPSQEYYYIQQKKTGRYLVFNGQLSGAGANRVRVHLETINPPAEPDEWAQFAISTVSTSDDRNGYWLFHPRKASNNFYLNITEGNVNSVSTPSSGKTDGPTGYPNVGGIIGQWSQPNNTSSYNLEIPKPVISQGEDKKITISDIFSPDVNIFYTQDGSAPTNSSAPYDGSFLPDISTRKIKAIAYNPLKTVESVVETFDLTLCAAPTINYDETTQEITISSTTRGATIYYTFGDETPTDPDFNTSTHSTSTITIPNISSYTVVKAFAAKLGYAPSAIVTQIVEKVATPVFDTSSGNSLVITCATKGATIYYTADDSEPSTSWPVYVGPLTDGISGKSFRAFATKANCITSDVAGPSAPIILGCATPIIKRGSGNTFTLSCSFPSEGVTIYYTTGSDDLAANPTSGTVYTVNTEVPFTGPSVTVKAIAVAEGYNNSSLAERTITEALAGAGTAGDPYLIESSGDFAQFIIKANDTGAGDYYQVTDDFTVGTTEAITKEFTGNFDGGLFTISGLGNPLFNSVNSGVVKNVILDNVGISGDTNVGAICNEAKGDTRIYNCGILATNSIMEEKKDGDEYDHISSCRSTISGSGYVGGIVGLLDGSSRVINCFCYADVSGGSEVGGIVGHNNVATTASNLQTMVMNCMFYGEVSGGSIAPIYNGSIITNDGDANGVNNFNYFWDGASYVRQINVYNCALAAETRFLQRFEFFRHLLNSNRELAAWWATGNTDNKDDMAKWVFEPSQIGTTTPYPILKTSGRYHSVVNIDNLDVNNVKSRSIGTRLSTLTVNIQKGSGGAQFSEPSGASITTSQLTLDITDKDPDHFNFNYYKVQLPYYNDVGTKNYTDNRVVTGWKIVSITGGTAGSYSTGADVTYDESGNMTATPYNFADRKCTNKDLYGTSNRVFNQGAYWDVPEGVTSITIEPYWGKAVYLADGYWDVTYKNGTETTKPNEAGYKDDAMTTAVNVPNVGGGQHYVNGNKYNLATHSLDETNGQIVYTSMSNAISSSALFSGGDANNHTVYDYAVVLVGNYHQNSTPEASNSKPYTVTSIDLDGDNEPDYSFVLRFNGRTIFHPVRYDFLNLIGLGMAQKTTGGTGSYNFGIMQPKAWFEVTNTALLRVTQFEYDRKDNTATRAEAPYILQGGVIEQWVSGQNNGVSNNTIYFHVGGNVWFKEFQLGTHIDKTWTSKHPPISVTGGDFNEFYLTGLYRGDITSFNDNAECYINGGRFGVLAGAGQEGIGDETKNTGNITWQIDNADITEFYGGGFNRPVEGNITTIISNSHVHQFCGGPKFGDMKINKTVKTTATNCTFDTYFGAGFGGNAYSREAPPNVNNIVGDYGDSDGVSNWNIWVNGKYTQAYSDTYNGVSTKYDYQYLPMSNNTQNVARIFIDYVRFSLATTHEVTSLLTDCHITGNFYGGGNLGKVAGKVNSTLTNCLVDGGVFGAGYSASTEAVAVMNTGGFTTPPFYDENLGAYFEPEFPSTVPYTWAHKDVVNSTDKAIDKINHILYTTEDLNTLGTVTGTVTLIINGTTVAESVFGGGEESAVGGNTNVIMNAGTVRGNVYGGGKIGSVGTYTTSDDMKTFTFEPNTGICNVTITDGTIGTGVAISEDGTFANGNVYGAGMGEADTYWCEKAMVYKTNVSIEAGTVNGTVYGGGEISRVENNATVTIGVVTPEDNTVTPTIAGNVFGAGAGLATHGYSALLRGDAKVTVQGNAQVGLSVYGGGEKASVGRFKIVGGLPSEPDNDGSGDCTVNVRGNAVIGANTDNNITDKGNVFGTCQGVVAPSSLGAYDKNYKSMQAVAQKTPEGTENTAWEYVEGSDNKYYWEYYPTLEAYQGFLNTLALASHPVVTIGGIWNETTETVTPSGSPTVKGSVYGGGQRGITLGTVAVNIAGGTVGKDVYGGGALADTNKGNQTAERYDEKTGLTAGVSSVNGLYTKGEGDSYTLINDADAKAEEGTKYYTRAAQSSINTTTVNLLGGTIKGDAYGGGLGQKDGFNGKTGDIAAVVWGDIKVNLGSTSGSSATSFYLTNYDAPHADVVKSGRVFGCNNLLGSPKGDVTVDVWKTVAGKDGTDATINRTPEAKKKLKEGDEGYVAHTYEVSAVYGGGNLADFTTVGKTAKVIIETCDVSIQSVYGGGNAAEVPGADVLIKGAYEIDEVFGGGNGKDPYTNGSTWITNSGANIGNSTNPGNANTLLTGGLVHAAYGGSNEKGTIFGNVQIDVGPGDDDPNHCTLDVEKMVGAGKNADVNGNLIMILGCKPSEKIPVLYAGADQANVNGNVELTITSGNYGEVFGGNNLSGAIRGHIKLNIEETGDCETPITIDNLYLGGNQAAYSVYGYYVKTKTDVVDRKKILRGDPNDPEETAVMSANGKLIFLPRESASDPHLPVKSYSFNESLDKWEWEVYDGTEGNTFTPYVQPKLNITSCTYIGNVFGGGYGTGAKLYGNPTVNINMIQGSHADDVHTFMANDDRLAGLSLPSTDNPNNLGVIGNVYGGGNAADVVGNPTVNIGTASTVDLVSTGATGVSVVGAYIIYNVYGGGKGSEDTFLCEKAMIGVDGAGARDADGDGKLDTEGGTTVNIYKGLVRGNVYGGGQIGRVEKNTVVTIGDGTNDGAGTENGTPTPVIRGSVFGGGKGEKEHGYAALVRGNPTVTIQGNAKVLHSVYGGGEIASVARYNVPKTEAQVQAAIAAGYKEAKLGMPYALKDPNSGTCTVIVRGYAEIGPDGMQMTKTGGPDDTGYVFGAGKGILPGGDYEFELGTTRRMVLYDAGVHTTVGQEGSKWQWVDPDHSDTNKNVWEYFATLDEYIAFIQTLALSSRTYVTITDNAFVKGSVYGGSENGIVQFDTDVKIQSGQIGCGEGETGAHPDAYWTSNSEDPTKFAECASWLFKDPYAPYDPYAKYKKTVNGKDRYYYNEDYTEAYYAEGGAVNASDGHTFYGNVFGGGSGSVPYFDHTLRRSVYLHSAGQVKGNTNVTISGGHILTNVYGGCEATNVGETANVTMTGGTIGVPRTDDQIIAHPLTGYLFGGGKGDQRIFFNKDTNVKDAVVKVEGGRIYGSVYGGGEDGHVLRNVTLTIGKQTTTTGENNETVTTTSGPKIGTKGTSYYDGHVFGGGRGFGGDALTAGNVGGSVDVNILDGDILGSVYGGGRLASVGYGLYLVDEEVTIDGETVKPYGTMRPDDVYDDPSKPTSTEDAEDFFTKGRGHINITISGGTIGNGDEYAYDANNQLSHTKGGNVFAGGMGRLFKLDNTTPISSLDWWKLGNVKSTKLTISGNAKIKSCVYGGGELGMVQGGNHTSADSKTVSTEIIINGGTIGTEVTEKVNNVDVTQYTFGSVFGGGYGSLTEKLDHSGSTNPTYSTYKYTYPKYIAGRVKGSTEVTMTDGTVLASVYGGGEMAAVGESKVLSTSDPVVLGETLTGNNGAPILANTYVTISGGTIGKEKVGTTYFGGAKMGNVYGGGSGHNNTVRSGHIYGNTNVTITGESTHIYHNVYGGGAYGTVGDFTYTTRTESGVQKVSGITGLHTERTNTGTANVTITGGIIGYDGKENGMVFGSSRGDINQPGERDDYTAWVYDANVTIGTAATPAQGNEGEEGYVPATDASGPEIKGSVYGSGENGHTFNNTVVTVNGGTIGIASTGAAYNIVVPDPDFPNDRTKDKTYSGAAYPYRGNVYGGGCGTDKYYSDHALETHDGNGQLFNPLAGIVYGTTKVNIKGGTVVRNVYGAGAMGSVGRPVTTTSNNVSTTTVSGGSTRINVSGGTIGVDGTDGDGNVFGAARGDVDATINESALVRKETNVFITDGIVKGNVYGGGELGCVGTFTISDDMRTFTWQDTAGATNTDDNDENTGICNVTVDGSSAVINGHVFGAGKGKDDTFWCEKGIAYSTNVSIKNGTVNRNVYGGGEVGRVETDTEVKVGLEPEEGGAESKPTINGSVFGGGAGVETHGYSALVRGNTRVTVDQKAHVTHSVYGGGEIASVGRYALDSNKMPSILQGGGYCYVTVQGRATIGDDVFGAGKGVTPHFDKTNDDLSKRSRRMSLKDGWESLEGENRFKWDYLERESDYSAYLETLALATHPEVTIDGNAAVSGSVFGGGELGLTKGSVIVNIQGGTITEDVYGGGSLANTNTTSSVDTNGDGVADKTVDPTTTVNLKGGTINRNVYGGGLGQLAKDAEPEVLYTADDEEVIAGTKEVDDVKTPAVAAVDPVEAKVNGDVLVKLNEPTTSEGTPTYGNCVVKGIIFGCNNLNGSPQKNVTVHVYKTVGYGEGHQKKYKNEVVNGQTQVVPDKDNTSFDLKAVYGGGNVATYCPDDPAARATATANVIIDGCDLTSIETVYGGGNAAAAPATHIEVNSCYEIGTVFGGGNGKDALDDGSENPGADVGYKINSEGTTESYGTGVALAELRGGTIHKAFGGSNTKGNVRTSATVDLNEPDPNDCPLRIEEVYGAGNEADQDGTSNIDLGCISYLSEIYGGAKNADVNNDIVLTIQSGRFDRVFGGNNLGGNISGTITVNIEEMGCHPIVIGQLFGGGNQAAYTAPWKDKNNHSMGRKDGPTVNVKSFTSIGEIYGGGYGNTARVTGDTYVNINECKGKYADITATEDFTDEDGNAVIENDVRVKVSENTGKWIHFVAGKNQDNSDKISTVWQPEHRQGAIGTIGNVFGGGNEAGVVGNTNINIGDKEYEYVQIADNIVAGETDVRDYYTRLGEGTQQSPYEYTEVNGNTSVTAEDGTTYYQFNNDTETYTEIDGIDVGVTDVSNYYIRSGEGTQQSPYVYSKVPIKAHTGVTYYKKVKVLGVNITGNVYGGGNAADVSGDTNVFIGQ